MDPKAGVLLSIPEFRGMSTNPPRGTVLAPELLLNVYLDRTGGYAPMYALTLQMAGVTAALSAGVGNDLFVETGTGTGYRDGIYGGVTGPYSFPLAGAVLVMPKVALSQSGDRWLTPEGTQAGTLTPGTVGVTGQPVRPDLEWEYIDVTGDSPPAGTYFNGSEAYQVAIEWVPTRENPYRGVTVLNVGNGVGSPPAKFYVYLTPGGTSTPLLYNVYARPDAPQAYRFVGSNRFVTGGRPRTGSVSVKGWEAPPPDAGEFLSGNTMRFTLADPGLSPSAAAYHQGRAYLAPQAVTYDRVNEDDKEAATEGVTRVTDEIGHRLYFSEITADGVKILPTFNLVNYIDVPFKVSRRIVALVSAGPYLYIFGDRELLILTGDPSTDARIESIGDSIGAVSARTVQQLSGTVFWRSDSGVMAVQGAQVREVGADVRDLLTGNSSTVDFAREIYHLASRDGILCYHAREGGWTLRQKDGEIVGDLISGGGTPYLLQDGALYSIGGEGQGGDTPLARLPMTIRWPTYEMGSWLARKTFRGIACGLDLETATATVLNQSSVDRDVTCDTSVTVTPTNTGVRLHTSRDGVNMTGVGIAVRLQVSTQDPRGILRPPLTIHGSMTGEEAWTDGR